MAELIQIEVAFASPDRQEIIQLQVPADSTVADVVMASGLSEIFPDYDLASMPKGIWGEKLGDTHVVKPGDRVEIYRPLEKPPMEARRERAERKRLEK